MLVKVKKLSRRQIDKICKEYIFGKRCGNKCPLYGKKSHICLGDYDLYLDYKDLFTRYPIDDLYEKDLEQEVDI